MAKKRGRGRPKGSKNKVKRAKRGKPRLFSISEHKLRPIMREAARTGLAEAIEHCGNFWNVSDGYKRYIEHQIQLQAEALMAAVKTALHNELVLVEVRRKKRQTFKSSTVR